MADRGVCAALMAACGILVALGFARRRSRVVWIVLASAGLINALALNLQGPNLLSNNVAHYYLGAKYSLPYRDFYVLVQAALSRPQVGIRDLDHPSTLLNADSPSQRAYYIDLMRAEGVAFDPLAPLDALARKAEESGSIARTSQRLLEQRLPASQIDGFRRDVRLAAAAMGKRPLTDDFGFNGSPFYAFVRQADPTLQIPFGRATALLNLAWQILAVILLAWLVGEALRLDTNGRLAIVALIFASWDFVAYALPGLIFGEMWLPVAVAVLAMRSRRAVVAGVAIAWAALIKLFPFILGLPILVQLVRPRSRVGTQAKGPRLSPWALRLVAACGGTVLALGFVALLSGRSWTDFLHKIAVEFQAGLFLGNNVSRSAMLEAVGVHQSPMDPILSLIVLCVLGTMFMRDGGEEFPAALARRSLVLLAALGWVVQSWLNYYAIAPLLLLPLYAHQHRRGAVAAVLAMAAVTLLPDFDDPLLLAHPMLHVAKILPYLWIPAWMVSLELRPIALGRTTRSVTAVVLALIVVATVGEIWRFRTIERLDRSGQEQLRAEDARGALESYEGMVRLSPRNGRAHMYKAIALASLGRMPEAREEFQRAAVLAPDNAAAQDNYGRALMMEGKLEEAALQLEKARAIAPHNTEILVVLANIRLAQGRAREADMVLRRAHELDPEDAAIADLLRQVGRG